MKNFKRILIYYPGNTVNESLLQRASTLAKNNDASLTFIDVIPEPTSGRDVFQAIDIDALYQRLVESRQRELSKLVERIKANGIDASYVIDHGKPFIEIIKRVIAFSHDLVMKSGEGDEGLHLGPIAMRLMRKCPVPVWALRPDIGETFDKIMLPLDISSLDDENTELNMKIMHYGLELARDEDAELHIVHAWRESHYYVFKGEYGIPEMEMQSIMDKTETQNRDSLQHFLDQFDLTDVKYESHLVYGEAEIVIPSLARDLEIDLIVMGTVARTGIEGILIGNTAETVLKHVQCSILALKPSGFVTPIKLGRG